VPGLKKSAIFKDCGLFDFQIKCVQCKNVQVLFKNHVKFRCG